MKAIEELYNISTVAKEIYNIKLKENLKSFNALLKDKTKLFLKKYNHIKDIYIDDKFKLILEAKNGSILDISLLISWTETAP